jgi:hypothetical protein
LNSLKNTKGMLNLLPESQDTDHNMMSGHHDDDEHPTSEFSSLLGRRVSGGSAGTPDNVTEVGTSAEFFNDGSYYIGEWEAHLPHGPGILTMPNGDRYEGSFENGLFHGTGMFLRVRTSNSSSSAAGGSSDSTSSDQSCFQKCYSTVCCCLRRNKVSVGSSVAPAVINASSTPSQIAHSPKVLVEPCVYTYAGQWKRGRQHGKGMQIWWNGYRFSGTFENGCAVGSGKLYIGNSEISDDGIAEITPMVGGKDKYIHGAWNSEHVFEGTVSAGQPEPFTFDPKKLNPMTVQSSDGRRKVILTSLAVLLIALVLAGVGIYAVKIHH